MNDRIADEERAYERLRDLLADARDVRAIFEAANLPLPPSLRRLFGDADSGDRNGAIGQIRIPPLKSPPRPRDVPADWIWIPLRDASPQTIVLALLRPRQEFTPAKQIAEEVTERKPDCNLGSVYNIGPRLQERGVIERDERGWRLTNSSSMPTLEGEHVWWKPQEFTKQELAAHRRLAIIHLLSAFSDGLQTMQITRQLQDSDLCKAPVNKDLVKMDMEALLAEKKVRRIARKWTVARDDSA